MELATALGLSETQVKTWFQVRLIENLLQSKSCNIDFPRIEEWSTRSNFDGKTPWQPPAVAKVLNRITPRSFGRKASLRKVVSLIKFSFSLTRCRQQQPATIEPLGEVFVHRLQSQHRQRVSIKAKFKLHSAKLLVKFRFNEEFQQRERKGLDEWEFWWRKRPGHCRGWDALLSLVWLLWRQFFVCLSRELDE